MNNQNNNQLEKLLEEIGQEGRPHSQFQKALLKSIKTKYKEIHGRTSWFSGLFKFKLQFASVLTLLTLTTTTIYAYNSDSIVSGDFLYPLKRSAEKVEKIFAEDEEEKSNYYSKMAERRTRELEHIEKESEDYSDTIRESEKMIELAKSELERLERRKPVKMEQLVDRKAIENEVIKRAETKREISPKPKNVTEIKNRREIDNNSTEIKREIKTETESVEIMELEAGSTTIEESTSLPINPENDININEKIELESNEETTVLRSRIEKVESDIEKYKEEQSIFLQENIEITPTPTEDTLNSNRSSKVDLKIDIRSNIKTSR